MKTLIWTTATALGCAALLSCAGMHNGAQFDSVGQKLYMDNCYGCHREASTLNEPESFLLETIHDGSNNMPSFEKILSRSQQRQIVDYILSQR